MTGVQTCALPILGVVLARRSIDNPWIDHVWAVHAALHPAPETAPGTLLSAEQALTLVYAGTATIELFVAETGNYRDNLQSGAPSLWIAARSRSDGGTPEFVRVSADPTEGEAFFESGSDVVAALPMAPSGRSGLEAFFRPRSVALIGASERPGSVGRALLETPASRVLVLNLKPQSGETSGYSPERYLEVLADKHPDFRLDAVVADPRHVEDEASQIGRAHV